jgi:hypothetical protein
LSRGLLQIIQVHRDKLNTQLPVYPKKPILWGTESVSHVYLAEGYTREGRQNVKDVVISMGPCMIQQLL